MKEKIQPGDGRITDFIGVPIYFDKTVPEKTIVGLLSCKKKTSKKAFMKGILLRKETFPLFKRLLNGEKDHGLELYILPPDEFI